MLTVPVQIKTLFVGEAHTIEGRNACDFNPAVARDSAAKVLLIETLDGAEVAVAMSREQIDFIEMVWLATSYGGEGEDEAETLSDLYRAFIAMRKRWRDRAVALGGRAA